MFPAGRVAPNVNGNTRTRENLENSYFVDRVDRPVQFDFQQQKT